MVISRISLTIIVGICGLANNIGVIADPHTGARAAQAWTAINQGLENATIDMVAVNPGNPQVIHAGGAGGAFRSTDGGATWVASFDHNTKAIAVSPSKPDIVYAAVYDELSCLDSVPFLISRDGGNTWLSPSLFACYLNSIVADPLSQDTVYVTANHALRSTQHLTLWKTTDNASTWKELSTRDMKLARYGFTIDPVNTKTIYSPGDLYNNDNVVDHALFKSTDGGENWSMTGLSDASVQSVAVDPQNNQIIYVGMVDMGLTGRTSRGMMKSIDGGSTWFSINNGLPDVSGIPAIVVDRDDSHVLYIGTTGGVFKSIDGGASWNTFSEGLNNLEVKTLALAPGTPNLIYAATGSGPFKIVDSDLPRAVATVSAASYMPSGVAVASIVTSFGTGLATSTANAETIELPTSLAGTSVMITDTAGQELFAQLLFVSEGQVNYLIPPETFPGVVVVTITSGDGTVSSGTAVVKTVAPGLFTVDSSGHGIAVALALRIKADGSQSYEEIAEFDPAQGRFIPRPIDLSEENEQVYLVLFGTGIRHRGLLSAVSVNVGGLNAEVNYAGPHEVFGGVDQVNALLPRGLAGRGEVVVRMNVDGQDANEVIISIR